MNFLEIMGLIFLVLLGLGFIFWGIVIMSVTSEEEVNKIEIEEQRNKIYKIS